MTGTCGQREVDVEIGHQVGRDCPINVQGSIKSQGSSDGGYNLTYYSIQDPYGVAVGGTVGHCLCTGLAVIGGRMIAQKISVRTVTIIGGIVFLAFAFSALFISPDSGF
ncbi:Transmembrane protein 165 [Pteropus alecto]|uniref:GDT1 family protein n=1 Tax=Pteropus alecto TaxID=9402 RepID=L5JZJ3_PTEAL|nr:Transmembrane protein 165 [Pteropus alecto]